MSDLRTVHPYLTGLCADHPGYVVTYHQTDADAALDTHYRLDYRGEPHLRLGDTFGEAKRALLAWRGQQEATR